MKKGMKPRAGACIVRVVVLAREARGVEVVAQRGADAVDLVRGDLLALAAAAEHDAAIGVAVDDRSSDGEADRRIVDRRFAVGAMIVNEVTKTGERLLEMFFENESRVICANRDTHNEGLYYVKFQVPGFQSSKFRSSRVPEFKGSSTRVELWNSGTLEPSNS